MRHPSPFSCLSSWKPVFALCALLAATLGCPAASPSSPSGLRADCDQTAQVYAALRPACVACHDQGANQPFFASEPAFRALLVQNPLFVIAGAPDDSELVRLLAGTGTRTYTQMPTAGPPWAQLSSTITIDDVRTWITDLETQPISQTPNPDAPTTRRLRVEEIVATLEDGLGLTDGDWLSQPGSNFNSPTAVLRGDLPVYSPDKAPGLHYEDQRLDASGRWRALGGPEWLEGSQRTKEITPSMTQALTQVAHAWCRMAVKKPNNTVFFGDPGAGAVVAAADTLASNPNGVRSVVQGLERRLLGDVDDDADVDALAATIMGNVANAEDAWVAVCAAVVLDPRFLAW